MQSIAPAPVPQSMQNQDMNSADNGIINSPRSPIQPSCASRNRSRIVSSFAHPVPPFPLVADMALAPLTDLRAQLAAVINVPLPHQQQQQQQHQQLPPHGYSNDAHASSSASPHEQNIDPAIGGPGNISGGMMSAAQLAAGDSGDESLGGDGRKGGKRELSQSKRAAQNRAAQRAFRQRKEGYIKKLEEQVRELHALEENYKAIQNENYSLREYIIHLQSRLIESQGDYPQPPANVTLSNPHLRNDGRMDQHAPPRRETPIAPMAPMNQMHPNTARSLAVAGLQSSKHGPEERTYDPNKRYKESVEGEAAEEEIIRSQLQHTSADGLPAM